MRASASGRGVEGVRASENVGAMGRASVHAMEHASVHAKVSVTVGASVRVLASVTGTGGHAAGALFCRAWRDQLLLV